MVRGQQWNESMISISKYQRNIMSIMLLIPKNVLCQWSMWCNWGKKYPNNTASVCMPWSQRYKLDLYHLTGRFEFYFPLALATTKTIPQNIDIYSVSSTHYSTNQTTRASIL